MGLEDGKPRQSDKLQPARTEIRYFDEDFEPTQEISKAIFKVIIDYDENNTVLNIFRELGSAPGVFHTR